jgi:hypothetical protein
VLQVDPKDTFYHDVSNCEVDTWVSKLRTQTEKSCTEGAEVAYAGWKDVPVQ